MALRPFSADKQVWRCSLIGSLLLRKIPNFNLYDKLHRTLSLTHTQIGGHAEVRGEYWGALGTCYKFQESE